VSSMCALYPLIKHLDLNVLTIPHGTPCYSYIIPSVYLNKSFKPLVSSCFIFTW
jgi:hypothetical protein